MWLAANSTVNRESGGTPRMATSCPESTGRGALEEGQAGLPVGSDVARHDRRLGQGVSKVFDSWWKAKI